MVRRETDLLRSKLGAAAHVNALVDIMSGIYQYTNQLISREIPIFFFDFDLSQENEFCYSSYMASKHYLRPYWEEFVEALSLQKTDHECWTIGRFPLPPTNILGPVLFNRSICELKLDSIYSLDDDIRRFACEFLENNTTIKRLTLKGYREYQAGKSLTRFCRAVESNNSLEELQMINIILSGTDEDQSKLSMILDASQNLQCLGLRRCYLGYDGVGVAIAEFLVGNPNLSYLMLGGTEMTDDDIRRIADALLTNTNLRTLDFGCFSESGTHSHITQRGMKALHQCLISPYTNTDLNSVANANHTCTITSLLRSQQSCPSEELVNSLNRFECPKDNRKFKILSILYATDCKGSSNEMDDIPLQLLPYVLTLISDTSSGVLEAPGKDPADDSSVVTDASCVSYDSELDDLEEALDEWVDDVYDDFHKSFLYAKHTGTLARVRMMYQFVRVYGVPLVSTNTYSSHTASTGKKKRGHKRTLEMILDQ